MIFTGSHTGLMKLVVLREILNNLVKVNVPTDVNAMISSSKTNMAVSIDGTAFLKQY